MLNSVVFLHGFSKLSINDVLQLSWIIEIFFHFRTFMTWLFVIYNFYLIKYVRKNKFTYIFIRLRRHRFILIFCQLFRFTAQHAGFEIQWMVRNPKSFLGQGTGCLTTYYGNFIVILYQWKLLDETGTLPAQKKFNGKFQPYQIFPSIAFFLSKLLLRGQYKTS